MNPRQGSLQRLQKSVTILRSSVTDVMGEVLELSSGFESGFGLISALVSVAALGLYALMEGSSKNDDDDSSPGGGLMQPVA